MVEMGKIFNLDSPFARVLSRVADVLILNMLTLICCIPIVTIGAALTAQHYVILKMVRDEDGYMVRSFFKSFINNLKQATCIWLIFLAFILLFALDVYIFLHSGIEFPEFMIIAVGVFAIVVAMVGCYVFPVLSKFDNSVKNTIINSFKISVAYLPKTILMLIINVLPVIMLVISLRMLLIVFLFGLSGTAYMCAMIYSDIFKKFEPEEDIVEDGDFSIKTEEEKEA